jgi:hypothetical protein
MARPSPPLPASRRLTACIAALLAASVAACGSSTATDRTATAGTATPPTAPGASSTAGSASALTPAACASTVAGTLGEVAERVYHAAVTGTVVGEAVGRVQSSTALASAVAAGNASAAGAALRALLRGQIARIEVVRAGRVLATAGAGPAIAPVRGSIPGTGASYVLSVQPDRDYVQVAGQVTGAQVLLLAGDRRVGGTIAGPPPASVPARGALSYAGQSYEVASLTGATYPAGALRIALLVPASALSCSGSASQTRVETLARAGENIYKEELASPTVSATLRRLESSLTFRSAVAVQNPTATREAIDGFFAAHIHVVRVRVTVGSHLLVDDGGPYVLAPVRGTLRSGGRVIGRFEMSVQDDAGYLKLAHLFTGAEVLMRVGGRQVQGTLSPGPATVPTRGTLSYGGRDYEAYTFTAEAFPSGPLEISLLIPA